MEPEKSKPIPQGHRGQSTPDESQPATIPSRVELIPETSHLTPNFISIDDFAKCEIRIGLIVDAARVPETDRLVRFSVDCGEEKPRTIVSGIAEYYPEPEVLVGKRVPVLMNLPPRKMKGVESQGMILYAVGADGLAALHPDKDVPPGTVVR